MPDQQSKIDVCKWWIERGFSIAPCQPNNKYLVTGYGVHKAKFKTIDSIQLFGFSNGWNVAVIAPAGAVVLDFDDPDLYTTWVASHAKIAKTYTERTPRGGAHVFFFGSVPGKLILVPGVEIKNICLVSPSVVNDKPYMRGAGDIIAADAKEIFSSLSRIGTRTVYALEVNQARINNFKHGNLKSIVAQIKSHWTCEHVLSIYRPDIELNTSPNGVVVCRCPFHDDRKPSFYIMPEIGVWGCHACGTRGDAINLYAQFAGISNREAIARMVATLQVRP